MSIIDDNLKKLNIILPDPKGPVGAYVATKIVGKLLFISGQVSIDKNAKLITGKIGKDLNLVFLTTFLKSIDLNSSHSVSRTIKAAPLQLDFILFL